LVAMATFVLLAWRLQRSRPLIVALVTACAAVALEPRFRGYTPADMDVAATLPPGFPLLSVTAERPIRSRPAYLDRTLATLPTTVALILLALGPEHVAAVLEYDLLGIGRMPLSQVVLLGGVLAVLVAGLLAFVRRRPADAGLAWAMLAVVLAFHAGAGSI